MRPPTPKGKAKVLVNRHPTKNKSKAIKGKKVVQYGGGLGDRGTSKKKVVSKKPGFLAQAGSGIAAVASSVGGGPAAGGGDDRKTGGASTTAPAPKTSTNTGGTYDPATKTVSGGTSTATGSTADDGRPDPFEGTPYAGMTPFQVAQKMVQEEIDSQRESILKAQALAQSKGTQDLNTLLGFNQALQQASSQIAPTYSNLLSQIGDSHNNFANGYQDALKTMQAQGAPLPPGATPGFAPPPNPSPSGAAAGSFIDAAQLSNPFSVLPAAYGRLGQMDATLLASNQAADIANTYGSQLADLNKGQSKATFDEWQQLQGLWDDTMNAWQKAQDDQANAAADDAAAQAKQAAADQKTYQWQYSQAVKQQNYLTETTGTMWMVDPKTLRVTQVIQNGQPVLTAKAKQQGATNARLTQSQRLTAARNAESVRYHNLTLQQRKDSAAAQAANRTAYKPASGEINKQYGWVMVWDPTMNGGRGGYTYALDAKGNRQKYKAPKTGTGKPTKPSTSSSVPGTPANIQKLNTKRASVATSAAKYAESLKKEYALPIEINGHTVYRVPTLNLKQRHTIKAKVWRTYGQTWMQIARALQAAGKLGTNYNPRQWAEYWMNKALGF